MLNKEYTFSKFIYLIQIEEISKRSSTETS